MSKLSWRRLLYTVLFAVATLFTVYKQFEFDKIHAEWYGINIYLYGIVLGALIAAGLYHISKYVAYRTDRIFSYKHHWRAPLWVVLLVGGSVFLSVWLGIYFTEPNYDLRSSYEVGHDHKDRYERSRAYYFFSHSSGGSGSYNSSSSSSSNSGEGLMIVFVVAVVLAVLVLSATVPSFWVVGSIALLMLLFKLMYDTWNDGNGSVYRN